MFRPSVSRLARLGTTTPTAWSTVHRATWIPQRSKTTTTATRLPTVCPSCSALLPTPLPACPKCRHISLVSKDLPRHELFGLPYEPNPFEVDGSALKASFRNLQRVIHPDLWSNSGNQDAALSLSAYVNNSYKILKWPVQRAEYILRRNGVDMGETTKLADDPEFTMEIMDAREGLEEASAIEEVEEIRTENQKRIKETSSALSQSIANKTWDEAKKLCIQLKYLEGVEDAGKEAGERLSSA